MATPEYHRDIVAATADNAVQLVRCTTAYGMPHYRVVVARLVDKRHASLKAATEHYAKATMNHLRHRYNEI